MYASTVVDIWKMHSLQREQYPKSHFGICMFKKCIRIPCIVYCINRLFQVTKDQIDQ